MSTASAFRWLHGLKLDDLVQEAPGQGCSFGARSRGEDLDALRIGPGVGGDRARMRPEAALELEGHDPSGPALLINPMPITTVWAVWFFTVGDDGLDRLRSVKDTWAWPLQLGTLSTGDRKRIDRRRLNRCPLVDWEHGAENDRQVTPGLHVRRPGGCPRG